MDAKDRLAGTLVMLYLFSSAVYVFSNHDYSEVISSYLAIVKPMLFYVYGMLFLAGLLGLLSSRGDSGQFRLVAKNFFLSIFLSIVLVPVVCVLFLLLGYPVIDGMTWLFSGGHDAEKFSSITAAAVVIIG